MFCWEEPLVAPPCLALRRVLAVLAPEAGSGEIDFLIDSLEYLRSDPVKPLVARRVPPGFKRDQLGLFGLHEIDHFQGPWGPLIELLEGVAVNCQLKGLVGFPGIHHLGRGLELGDDVALFDQVDDAFNVDERIFVVPGFMKRDRKRDIRSFGFLRRKLAVQGQHFLGQECELHLIFPVFVPDFGLGPLAVPVRVENLEELFERHSAVGHRFPMEPGQGRMNGAPESQARRFEGLGKKIDVVEFVLEAALGIEIDLGARKVLHRYLLSPRRADTQSFCWPLAW